MLLHISHVLKAWCWDSSNFYVFFIRKNIDKFGMKLQIKTFIMFALLRRSVLRLAGFISAGLWATQLKKRRSGNESLATMRPIWPDLELHLKPPAPPAVIWTAALTSDELRRGSYHNCQYPRLYYHKKPFESPTTLVWIYDYTLYNTRDYLKKSSQYSW